MRIPMPAARFEVIGPDGRRFGPFKTMATATLFATIRWRHDRWHILELGGR